MAIGNGLCITRVVQGGGTPTPTPTYSAEATALFARMTSQPDDTRKGLIDTCITSLKSAGVWSKLECLWLTAAHDAQAGRLNWIGASFNLAAVSSPTFTTDRGYAGDGAASYLNTSWVSNSSSIATQDSTTIGGYLNAGTDTASSTASMMGVGNSASNGLRLLPRSTSNAIGAKLNEATIVPIGTSATTRLGSTTISRTASNLITAYRNGSSIGTSAQASAGRSTATLFLCGYGSDPGTLAQPIDNRIAAAWIGGALTSTEVGNLASAISTFVTAIGAN